MKGIWEAVAPYWFSIVVVLVGVWILWRLRRSLMLGEQQGLEHLASRRGIMAVPTTAGEVSPTEDAKRRGARSIEARFTVHRRLVLPLVAAGVLALAALPFLSEVPATGLSLVAAIVTGVLGVAARPVLENAISGLVMSFSRVVRLGDTVVFDDYYGTIEDISVTHTTIRIWDWRRYVVPNSRMLQSKLINFTLFDQHIWACVEFWVALDSDTKTVHDISIEVARQSPYNLVSEEPELWFLDMQPHAMKCWLVAWTQNAAAAWAFKDDVRGRLMARFHEAGIQSHGYRQVLSQNGPHPSNHAASPEPGARIPGRP